MRAFECVARVEERARVPCVTPFGGRGRVSRFTPTRRHRAEESRSALADAHPTRFDGPPRVIAHGYQLHDNRLVGPRDLFADPSFDNARQQANDTFDYLRRLGPFEPHRLPLDEMEYTTMPEVANRLVDRWEPLSAPAKV